MKKVIISSQNRIYFIDQQNIVMCKSDSCYTIIYLTDLKEIMVCKSLSKFIQELDNIKFVRVSQSYAINKDCILSIDKKKKCLELVNEIIIPFTVTIKILLGQYN